MASDHPIGPITARRIVNALEFVEGFDGDNVRRSGKSVYVGSGGRGVSDPPGVKSTRWARVTSILPTAGLYGGEEMVRTNEGAYKVKTGGVAFDADRPLYERNLLPVASLNCVVPIDLVKSPEGYHYEFDSPSRGEFWAQITANEADGDNAWTYTFTQQVRATDGWAEPDNARTATTARNSMEANNAATGIQGNGVDLDGQIFTDNSGLELQPIRGNPVVWMVAEPDGSGGFYYTFTASNAIDGECA